MENKYNVRSISYRLTKIDSALTHIVIDRREWSPMGIHKANVNIRIQKCPLTFVIIVAYYGSVNQSGE